MLEKFFKIKERNSSIRTEIIGGLTTFFAMAAIIFVNPNTLCADLGDGFFPAMPAENWVPVMIATCLAAAVGCLLTGFLANVPFAQAPDMGLGAFFTYTLCLGMGYTWQQGLTIVLISGAIFFLVAISPLRSKIIEAIPKFMKSAMGAGIGLFIAFIGFLNVGMIQFADGVPALNLYGNSDALLMIIGVAIITILLVKKVKGAIFIGIILTTLIGIPLGVTVLPTSLVSETVPLSSVMFKFDFPGIMSKGPLTLIIAILSFAMIDCFDTVGTLVGTASNAGLLDKDGNFPGGDKALIADSIATMTGACIGTATVTTYVESASGISEGARTGLAPIVTAILFLIFIIFAPIANIVPAAATSPALIIIGVMMMGGATDVNWDDYEEAIPAFITIATMPFAYSISEGIGFGFITYVFIKLVKGKIKEVSPVMIGLAVLFLAVYIIKGL